MALSIVAIVFTALALPFTVWAAWATNRQAQAAAAQTEIQRDQVAAAREQTELQREMAREAQQPYVWADIQPDMQQGTAMHIAVGNSGPSVAHNVRVTFDPPLPVGKQQSGRIENVQEILAQGLHSLAPGRVIRWTLGAGYDLLSSDEPQVRTVRVEATGPHGPVPATTMNVDISQWRQARDAPDGSLHHVRGSIKELTKAVTSVDQTLKRVGENLSAGVLDSIDQTEFRDSFTRSVPSTTPTDDGQASSGPGSAQLPPA